MHACSLDIARLSESVNMQLPELTCLAFLQNKTKFKQFYMLQSCDLGKYAKLLRNAHVLLLNNLKCRPGCDVFKYVFCANQALFPL